MSRQEAASKTKDAAQLKPERRVNAPGEVATTDNVAPTICMQNSTIPPEYASLIGDVIKTICVNATPRKPKDEPPARAIHTIK